MILQSGANRVSLRLIYIWHGIGREWERKWHVIRRLAQFANRKRPQIQVPRAYRSPLWFHPPKYRMKSPWISIRVAQIPMAEFYLWWWIVWPNTLILLGSSTLPQPKQYQRIFSKKCAFMGFQVQLSRIATKYSLASFGGNSSTFKAHNLIGPHLTIPDAMGKRRSWMKAFRLCLRCFINR